MGICESKNRVKTVESVINNEEIDKSAQTFDYQNQNQNTNIDESVKRPSKFNQSEKIISTGQEIQADKKPKLVIYEPSFSLYYSGKRSETNNKTSIFSSGKSEEEIINRGEIIKGKFNEKDFVNNSFKKEVIDHEGIMIKEKKDNNTLCESQKTNSISDMGFGNISEILSSKTVLSLNNGVVTNDNNNNNSLKNISAIKGYNDQMINVKQKSNNNLGPIINGKYNINNKLIKNNNNFQNNGAYLYQKNNMGSSFGSKRSSVYSLNHSNRINVSLHESCPRIDSYLHVPNKDKPLPDIDEISENID